MASDALAKLSALAHYASSRRALPVYKATLAYLLCFILVFSRKFDSLSEFPATFSSMVILIIIGGAGKSIGACIQSTFLALLGVGVGSICFVVLAKLSHSQVAQGFVFAIFLYPLALVKAQGLKFFAFALLAILMAFNGIYTSILDGGFNPKFLEEYIKAYCWGAVIVLAVNILVFPISSEKELRRTLNLSLEHIATFLHLLAKGYTLELTEEERVVRDQLAQNIRADFGYLTQKIDETSIEINWSRFSMSDYQSFVGRTRGMQLALITAYSSLYHMEKKDLELFKTCFLPNTMASFNQLRGALNLTMREINCSLDSRAMEIPSSQAGYAEFMDVERQDSPSRPSARPISAVDNPHGGVDERLASVSKRLAEEFGEDDISDDGAASTAADASSLHVHELHELSTATTHVQHGGDIDSQPAGEARDQEKRDEEEEEQHVHVEGASETLPAPQSRSAQTPAGHGAKPSITINVGEKTTTKADQDRQAPGYCIRSLRRIFDRFTADQHDTLVQCLVDGNLHGSDDSLRLSEPMPSLLDMYDYRYVPVDRDDSEKKAGLPNRRRPRKRRTWMDVDASTGTSGYNTPLRTADRSSQAMSGTTAKESTKAGDIYYEIHRPRLDMDPKAGDEVARRSHHSLTRVYSFMFAMEQFVSELESLYHCSTPRRDRRLHVHLYESIRRPHQKPILRPLPTSPTSILASNLHLVTPAPSIFEGDDVASEDLGVAESLALLEHRDYHRPKQNIWQTLEKMEEWLRGPTSTFAAKTAAAGAIFSVLILHPTTREWFINFGLTSGAITIMTALTPTLGQSILTFVLQILGSGLGYLWALILLEIFRDVGGYHFNPFGIVCMLIPYALILMYVLHEMPKFFVAALLAMNGTGTMLIAEWSNRVVLGNTHYDTPVFRFGKSFATLGVALGIAATFQLFILRNPARRTLRKKLGALLFAQLSYMTLLQAYARAAMPSDPSRRAPDAALKRVDEEMRHRELKLQAELIGLRPLVQFASAEPQFSRVFRADIINRVLRTSQIILDRMRECRTAIASQPLPDTVLENFVQVLSPYRRRNSQVLQLEFYLIASSVSGKSPLLREAPVELEGAAQVVNFMHDVLVLAARHARTEAGAKTIRSGAFTRYFHYIVGITSLGGYLLSIEEACKDLFGELEDHLA